MNIYLTVVGIILVVFTGMFVIGACKLAGDYDRAMEEEFEKRRKEGS